METSAKYSTERQHCKMKMFHGNSKTTNVYALNSIRIKFKYINVNRLKKLEVTLKLANSNSEQFTAYQRIIIVILKHISISI